MSKSEFMKKNPLCVDCVKHVQRKRFIRCLDCWGALSMEKMMVEVKCRCGNSTIRKYQESVCKRCETHAPLCKCGKFCNSVLINGEYEYYPTCFACFSAREEPERKMVLCLYCKSEYYDSLQEKMCDGCLYTESLRPPYNIDDEDSEDLNDDDRRDREFEKAELECKINSLLSKSLRKMKTTCNNKFELEILDEYLKKFENDMPNYKKRLLSDRLN